MDTLPLIEGNSYDNVTLETCKDEKISRPRVKPITHFKNNVRVEFPRALRTEYPIGTRYRATVKVCQKKEKFSGKPIGPPYLSASNIGIIVESIPDFGLRARLTPGTVSDRSYYYIWQNEEK